MTEIQESSQEDLTWQTYFEEENKSFFKRLCRVHREVFIARAVRSFTDKYFPASGFFVEAGAGTSQSSSRIQCQNRKLIALDLNHYVLKNHNVLEEKVQGNIFALPFQNESLDGIWNLGVMEHFTDQQIVDILSEMKRVLKPEARIVLFWPPPYAPFQIVLNSITWCAKFFFRKKVDFFPDEINRYKNKDRARWFLNQAGFRFLKSHFTILDLFSYAIVVAEKSKE